MMDELIDNLGDDSDGEEDSEERYSKLKKEEAGTQQTEAEKRFQELKDKAKEEFIEKQRKREQEEDEEDDSGDPFVTH
ncbi:MAG: hypothetical protein ABEJ64_02105 [Candidatus Nanohaloarchaea archaeon]